VSHLEEGNMFTDFIGTETDALLKIRVKLIIFRWLC